MTYSLVIACPRSSLLRIRQETRFTLYLLLLYLLKYNKVFTINTSKVKRVCLLLLLLLLFEWLRLVTFSLRYRIDGIVPMVSLSNKCSSIMVIERWCYLQLNSKIVNTIVNFYGHIVIMINNNLQTIPKLYTTEGILDTS